MEQTFADSVKGRMETHLDEDKDLCVLAPPVIRDRLTRLLEGPLAFLFRVSLFTSIKHS